MSSSFLELTNRVLRRINEVELTETSFADAKGVQALAKDAINDCINRINAQKFEWPFNAYEHEQLLQNGESEYAWPDALKIADWNSFEIQKDETLKVQNTHLVFINRDEWYAKYRDFDRDDTDGVRIPQYVFAAHGAGFGVTPSPDKDYTIRYRYWITPSQLVGKDDTTTIPTQFEYVIVDGALYIMNMFREGDNILGPTEQTFQSGISAMVDVLLTGYEHMYDMRVSRVVR